MNKINFWVLNILISSNILKYPLFFVAFWLIGTEHSSYPQIIFENTILQVLFIVTVPIVFIALYWLFKTFVFIVIFEKSPVNSYTYKFFKKFQNDDEFQENIQLKAMFCDVFFFVLEAIILYLIDFTKGTLLDKSFLDYIIRTGLGCLICGTGVFLSYFVLGLLLNKYKKRKEYLD